MTDFRRTFWTHFWVSGAIDWLGFVFLGDFFPDWDRMG